MVALASKSIDGLALGILFVVKLLLTIMYAISICVQNDSEVNGDVWILYFACNGSHGRGLFLKCPSTSIQEILGFDHSCHVSCPSKENFFGSSAM
ncbi:hypothetical protein ACFX2H_023355 [Malus domestica]